VQPKRYWDVPFKPHRHAPKPRSRNELIERLREAVHSQMVAEVPLGAFLSGGVDSSAVVAMMARLATKPVNTCSIGFNDPEFDESEYATQVAQRYRPTTTQIVDKDDYGLIDTLAGLYDEPFADSSAIPTYRVCQLARKRVTVALSGDGGDENFAGYRRYRFAWPSKRALDAAAGLRKPLFGTLGSLYPKADWAPRMFRAKTTFEALARDLVEGYFHGVSKMADRVRASSCSPLLPHRAAGLPRDRRHARPCRQGADRRSAVADPVPRLQDLAAGRHPDQGRPRQHGALARSARAAARPYFRRMGVQPAERGQAARAAKASTCSRRRSSRTCRTTSCTAPRWAFRFHSRPGCAGRCAIFLR
jgi:hypothetical protein